MRGITNDAVIRRSLPVGNLIGQGSPGEGVLCDSSGGINNELDGSSGGTHGGCCLLDKWGSEEIEQR